MAASQTEVLRSLRVAFTAQELEELRTHDAFASALDKCSGAREETQKLITLGGALLAERSRARSKLGPPKGRD